MADIVKKQISTRILMRNAPLADWEQSTVPLLCGEIALAKIDHDDFLIKIGTGDKTWNQLSAADEGDLVIPAKNVAELQETIDASINKLDFDKLDVGAAKTLQYIRQDDGKISAEIVDIQIDESQVNGLCADLDARLLSSSFNTWKNETGLSTADGHAYEADYQVVFKKDITELTGVMHFKGVASNDELSTGSTDVPVPPYESATDTPKDGDVVIDKVGTEFVWAQSKWNKIGDENLYAKKTELEAETAARIAADDVISNAVSTFIETTYPADKAALEARDTFLSGKVDDLLSSTVRSIYLNGEQFEYDSATNVASCYISCINCGGAF